jgi:hypothetical protein
LQRLALVRGVKRHETLRDVTGLAPFAQGFYELLSPFLGGYGVGMIQGHHADAYRLCLTQAQTANAASH